MIASLCILSSFVPTYIIHKFISSKMIQKYGETIYEHSFFLKQFNVFLCVFTVAALNYLILSIIGDYQLMYITLLSFALAYGYYLTFHSILLTFFEKKYQNLLSSRYKISTNDSIDEALVTHQNGSISYHVAHLISSQFHRSKMVVFPVGSLFLILVVICLTYLPVPMLKWLMFCSYFSLISSFMPWFTLIPCASVTATPKKNINLIRSSPAIIFPIVFFLSSTFLYDILQVEQLLSAN